MEGTLQFVFGSRTGDRWRFAIEFEAYLLPDGRRPRLWNEWWGALWLWVNGQLVGDTAQIETVMNDLGSLHTDAMFTGRQSDLLSSRSAKEALDIARWSVYGNDDENMRKIVGDRNLEEFEILPRGKAFFDGWEAILLENGNEEHFIYRRRGEEVVDVAWPIGTFRDVVNRAKDEFENMAKSHLIGGNAAWFATRKSMP